jgi:hypothetical protein
MARLVPANGLVAQAFGGTTPGQGENVADASAPTAYSAHASGSTTVTSNAATDLDTTAAALATLRGEVAALTTKFNSLLASLEAAGYMASS